MTWFLETLSQLHGTGLFFKNSLGGSKEVLQKFPNIEEQIQIRKFAQSNIKIFLLYSITLLNNKYWKLQKKLLAISFLLILTRKLNLLLELSKCFRDVLSSKENREFIKKHFVAFIRYLEETDSDLKNITSYMRKMETYLFKILKVLDDSGQMWENCQ